MKKIALTICLIVNGLAYSQSIITITIESSTNGKVDIKNNGKPAENLKDVNFGDGKGELIVINQTTDNSITIDFVDNRDKLVFKIPSDKIPVKSGGIDGNIKFSIDKDGKLTPAITAGVIKANYGIKMSSSTSQGPVVIQKFVEGEENKRTTPKKSDLNNALYRYVEREISRKGYLDILEHTDPSIGQQKSGNFYFVGDK